MSWTHEQTSALIELYRNCELLYNTKHPLYYKRYVRAQTLDSIARDISCVRPNTTATEVKLKVNSLRTQFNKELQKARGVEGDINKIKLWCFEPLLFLMDHSDTRATTTNVKIEVEDTVEETHLELKSEQMDEEHVEEQIDSEENVPASRRTKANKKRKTDNNVQEMILSKIDSLLDKVSREDDEWTAFANFIVSEIKQLNNKNQRKAKRGILRVIETIQDEEDAES